LSALMWPLFAWSSGSQPATVVAGTIGEGAILASVHFSVVGSASHCGGEHEGEGTALASARFVGVFSAIHGCGHDRRGRCCGICSIGRRGLSQALWWLDRHLRALLWPLFAWSALAKPATLLAINIVEGAAPASPRPPALRLVGLCGGSHGK
jgi:hypothetical protein